MPPDNCFIIQHIENKAQFYYRKAGDDLYFCHFSPRHTKLRISLTSDYECSVHYVTIIINNIPRARVGYEMIDSQRWL